MKPRNFVAKYAKQYNKSVVMKDKKREWKKSPEFDEYDELDGYKHITKCSKKD